MRRFCLPLLALAVCLLAAAREHVTQIFPGPGGPPPDHVQAGALPDPHLTPGAIYSDVTLEEVKHPNFSASDRDVTESVKRFVFGRYGINPDQVKPGEYEIDHLVPLSWGGSNDYHNLWPQSYITQPLNAHVKDHAEVDGLKLIREGKLKMSEAQHEIAKDWTKFFIAHVGPLPTGKTGPPAKKHTDD